MQYLEDLKAAVAAGNVVFVVGAGASKAMTANARSADWMGLVRSGIDRAVDLGTPETWRSLPSEMLDYSSVENDVATLLSAASMVQSKLKESGSQAYASWLHDTVGSLSLEDRDLGHALGETGCPILTTNYDNLLEQVTGRSSSVWTRIESIRDVLRNDPPMIGHIHGVWSEPDSVVFSESDYSRILGDAPAQSLQSALYASKTFVFVGYGGGIEDPNFGWMLKTHRDLFPEARHYHYRLVLESDKSESVQAHANDNIRVLSYGQDYSDLPSFIRSLSSSSRLAVGYVDYISFARESLVDQVRGEAVIADSGALDVEECDIDNLIVDPIFLSMPHEKFANDEGMISQTKPRVIPPSEVYEGGDIVVVAGDEGAGMTTALRWLAFYSSAKHAGTAPLYVDARRCRGPRYALDKEVRAQALVQRLIDDKKQAVPGHVLSIDNVVPAATAPFRSLMEDVKKSTAVAIFIGTRQGNEAELVEALSGAGREVEVVYIGKPGRAEVQALAELIAPDGPSGLVDQVIEVLRREHLQRNPFNICLLLMLLSQGTGAMVNASDTAVLDKYVQLLTGRSGNFLDPRWSLDPQNRESVLGDLARRMVRERRGSLPKIDVLTHLEDYFRSVDWQEDSVETLETFIRMRVLRTQGDNVSFQQSSYLHLFAAKSAIEDSVFLEEILQDPLYFAPIIRHYAALVRNSEKVAKCLVEALDDEWPSEAPAGVLYRGIKLANAPAELSDSSSDNGSEETRAVTEESESDRISYDWSDDQDAQPFPLDDPSGWPLVTQLMWILDLSSRVVRDSDQIRTLELKDRLFSTVLDRWGYLIDVMSVDPALHELADSISDAFEEDSEGISEEEMRLYREQMVRQIPPFVAYAGISSTLASRKLLLSLNRVHSGDHDSSAYSDIAAALLAASINANGWASRLPNLAKQHGNLVIVSEFLLPLMVFAYQYQTLSSDDASNLEEFLKLELGQLHAWDSKRSRDDWVARQIQRIVKERAVNARNRLPEGETTLDEITRGEFDEA